jgi:hypothetical protein
MEIFDEVAGASWGGRLQMKTRECAKEGYGGQATIFKLGRPLGNDQF